MPELHNVYIDESLHLEHDESNIMVLGGVWCPARSVATINRRISEIKVRHGIPSNMEVKWTKLSPSKVRLYLDLIDYFFDDDDLHFRGVLIPNKSVLRHNKWKQTHDSWYYKMCFRLIDPIVNPDNSYAIYLDIKDTRSELKRKKLEDVLRSKRHDYNERVIKRVQQIRSHEVGIMQLTDIIIGAIGYHNRGLGGNSAKDAVIRRIQQRSRWSLEVTTWLGETKFNMLRWMHQEG